jgi:prepilin peptidase CpaA
MESIGVAEIAATTAVLAYVGLVFAAGLSDILTLSIPNRFTAAIILLYPSYVLSASHPIDWPSAILIALGALSLGFALYIAGLWGGGDAKFLGAVALWAGPDGVLDLVLTTALAGGVVSVFILLQHYLPHAVASGFFRFRAALPHQRAQPVPYGVAISIGALYGAFTLLKVS